MLRKITYRLYPTVGQAQSLDRMFESHRVLYNAALEQRVTAYRMCGGSVSFKEQCRGLTELRAAMPEWAELNAQSEQVTLKRVDLAYAAFFRRVRDGAAKAGFPRFKSARRFSGWGYKSHGDGWALKPGPDWRHGRIRLSGVGEVKVRGKARTPDGTPKTCEILRKGSKWYVSVTVECEPKRSSGGELVAYDWGCEHFLTFDDGTTVANPRWFRKAEGRLADLERSKARKVKFSKNWWKVVDQIGVVYRKVAECRKDFLHKESAKIVDRAYLIGTEQLAVSNMVKSSRGTVDDPGTNVAAKSGLAKSILDGSPGRFNAMVQAKAEEAALPFIETPTRRVAPSQHCPECGTKRKKTLDVRRHECECGASMPRDQAAALIMAEYALWETGRRRWQHNHQFRSGREPSQRARSRETPPIAA